MNTDRAEGRNPPEPEPPTTWRCDGCDTIWGFPEVVVSLEQDALLRKERRSVERKLAVVRKRRGRCEKLVADLDEAKAKVAKEATRLIGKQHLLELRLEEIARALA